MDTLVLPGKLKFKKERGIKKKKSKTAEKSNIAATALLSNVDGLVTNSSQLSTNSETANVVRKTKAELAFEQRQQQLLADRIMKKAQKSHKERVEEFNNYLENLTEINDIPKVSWTK